MIILEDLFGSLLHEDGTLNQSAVQAVQIHLCYLTRLGIGEIELLRKDVDNFADGQLDKERDEANAIACIP